MRKAAEEAEAKERAVFEAEAVKAAEREAKKQAAIAEQAAKREAAMAAAKEKAAAASASKPDKAKPAAAAASPKANKYGTVQTINKQAERVAAREASGEEAPKFFFSP